LAPSPESSRTWSPGQWPPPFPLYGGDYNPEQWPSSVWPQDVALMREAGVNMVSLGIFSWARLEPSPGSFDFGWLREVLDLLHGAGIYADLATPTAAAPPWLTTDYPSVLPVTREGERLSQGSRGTFCVNSPVYRRFATRIVRALAAEFGDHPALRAWHVSNEYACEVPACYCDNCAVAFRGWLTVRHGTIEALNEAWGTAFWSQRYRSFDEVLPPRRSSAQNNPSQVLDYHRFVSDSYLAEYEEERSLLRAVTPDMPITTNFMGFFEPLDYFAWAPSLDFASEDSYPDPAEPDSPARAAMDYDLIRSLKPGVPWLLMEQTTSRVNWRPVNALKAPGRMRLGSLQAIARGAAGACFFQWRASLAGAERFHGAMLPHAGVNSPVWREAVSLGRELAALGDSLRDAVVAADHAIVFSWPSRWALDGPGQPSASVRSVNQAGWMYQPLFSSGVGVDFVPPSRDLAGYSTVLVPNLHLVTSGDGARLVEFAERGGTVLLAFWSGIVDERNHVYPGPYGGPLRPLIGADVVDVAPLASEVSLEWADGRRTVATAWMDIIDEPESGAVLARYASGPWAGRPAVLSREVGEGRAIYLGTQIDQASLARLLDLPAALSAGVERVVRRSPSASYEFLLNHGTADAKVDVGAEGTDVLTGVSVAGEVAVPPAGVVIIRRD
jgi:beta-galactosidase